MRSTFICLTTFALLLGACGADDEDTTVGGTDPSTSTDPATTDPATTDPVTTDPVTTDPATTDTTTTTDPATTDPGTETTDPGTETGPDPDTGTSETGPSECPPEVDDDECSLCTKENCCPELMECQANKDCDCVVACISEMGLAMQDACLEMCGVKAVPAEATGLQTCVATSGCLGACL